MFELKSQISAVIFSTFNNPIDRKKWLGPEISELGLKHNGLDDIPLAALLPLASLYTNGLSNEEEISKYTEIKMDSLIDYLKSLKEYNLIGECSSTGKYQLTNSGSQACKDIFNNVVIRKRFELQRDLEHIDIIFKQLDEL